MFIFLNSPREGLTGHEQLLENGKTCRHEIVTWFDKNVSLQRNLERFLYG